MKNAICGLIDHRKQYDAIRDSFAKTGNDRSVFWYEAHSEDWPEMLAWHLLFKPWPKNPTCHQRIVSGQMPGCEPERILGGWYEQLPPIHSTTDSDKLRTLREWINQAPLTIFHTVVTTEFRAHLPDYLRGAHQALKLLGALNSGTRVIVLFACHSSRHLLSPSSLLWWLHYRRRARKLSEAHALRSMRRLEKQDIDAWLSDLPRELLDKYDHDLLKSEIFDKVFQRRDDPVRFHEVRRYLIGNNGLDQAHKG